MASITVAQTQGLWAVNRPGATSVIAILRFVITLVLLVTLTQPLGVVGPAIALLAGYLTVIILSGVTLRPFLARPARATWPLRERAALLAAYAAGFAAAHGTEQLFPSTLGVMLCMVTATVAYSLTFTVFGGFNPRDRHRIGEVAERLRAKLSERGRSAGVEPLDDPQ